MKVLHLFNEIKFSGAEIMYANAVSIFKEEEIEFIAFSTGKKKGEFASKFEEEGIEVHHRPINFLPISLEGMRYYINLYQFLKREQIDVLHIHRNDLYFVAFIAWLVNVKCIKTMHSTFKNRWFTWPVAVLRRFIVRKLFNTTFHTIGESVYQNELNYYKNPSVKVNNWFDSDRFYPAKSGMEKEILRNKLGIPEDSFVIISTGGCSANKNHHAIIKAVGLINDKIENLRYLHLGTGEMELDEKELACKLGVNESIRFLGNKSNVRDYLAASDVYIMPSRFEGLGNATLEAMACKVPVILYDSPGLRDLIDSGDNGFLIEHNYRKIKEKILTYYKNQELVKRKASNAYNFVNDKFSIYRSVSKMIELYKA